MTSFVFNVAKGKVKYYAQQASPSGLVAVFLKTAESDATLKDYLTLSSLLAAGGGTTNVESDATNYVRKQLANVNGPGSSGNTGTLAGGGDNVGVDVTNDYWTLDADDVTWSSLGGATNNNLVKLLVCYYPTVGTGTKLNTSGSADSAVIPLTSHDFAVTTDGTDLTATIANLYRAQ